MKKLINQFFGWLRNALTWKNFLETCKALGPLVIAYFAYQAADQAGLFDLKNEALENRRILLLIELNDFEKEKTEIKDSIEILMSDRVNLKKRLQNFKDSAGTVVKDLRYEIHTISNDLGKVTKDLNKVSEERDKAATDLDNITKEYKLILPEYARFKERSDDKDLARIEEENFKKLDNYDSINIYLRRLPVKPSTGYTKEHFNQMEKILIKLQRFSWYE